MSKRWFVAIISVTAIWGCGGPPSHVIDPGQPALDPGYTAVNDAESGISLAFPSGWQAGQFPAMTFGLDSGSDSTDPGATDAAAAMKKAAEKASKASPQEVEALRKQGIVLMFNDSSRPIPGEENTRFYMQIKSDTHGLDDAAGEFARTMVFPTKTPMETPIGKAIRLNSDYTSKGGDKIHEIAYVWADGPTGYALRLICTGDKQPIAQVAEPVMKTVRIKPQKD